MDKQPARLLGWGAAKALLRKPTESSRFVDLLIEQSAPEAVHDERFVFEPVSYATAIAPYTMSNSLNTGASTSLVIDQTAEITTVEFVEEATIDIKPSQAEIESANDAQVAVLNEIARAYAIEQKYTECEEVYKRIIALRKIALGQDHEKVAMVLSSLGWFYYHQHDLEKADSALRNAAGIVASCQTAGPKLSASIKNNLAEICRLQHNYDEAEKLAHESLQIRQSSQPTDEQEIAQSLNTLGRLYCDEGKLFAADQYFKRALAIQEKVLNPIHPDLATTLEDYAILLRKMVRRSSEAKGMEVRARQIRQVAGS